MKTIKWTMVLAPLALLAMVATCSGCENERAKLSEPFRIEFVDATFHPHESAPERYKCDVRMRIYGADVAQKISMQGQHIWTEHISVTSSGFEWRDDHHVIYEREIRDVVSAPASVEGAAPDSFGTSILWAKEGFPQTAVWFQGKPIQGRIVNEDASREVRYRLEAREDGIYLNGAMIAARPVALR